jgi:hypothetical protein
MTAIKPSWYQQPMVWLLILFPAMAVVGGMITLYLAISSNDGLIVDDYYKQGLEINRSLERDKVATQHGLQATLQINTARHLLSLNLKHHSDYALPNLISLHFQHHTRSGFDKTVELTRTGDNFYQGTLPELVIGGWTVELSADNWRLLTSMTLPTTPFPPTINLLINHYE